MDLSKMWWRSGFSLILLLVLMLHSGTAKPRRQQHQADDSSNAIRDTTGNLLLTLIDRIQIMEDEIQTLRKDQQELKRRGFNGPTLIGDTPVLNSAGPLPLDCEEARRKNREAISGLYNIKPRGGLETITVYCDMTTAEGGWTVIQRRMDGMEDFNRDWRDYSRGFGDPTREHWLGNEFIHSLTTQYKYKLRVELTDWNDEMRYAEYSGFEVESRRNDFRMRLEHFLEGNASDALTYHKGSTFTTLDKDNDDTNSVNCARVHNGGWWFKSCDRVNLNGLYYPDPIYAGQWDDGIEWKLEDGPPFYSLKATEMKIKPMGLYER